MDNSELQSIIKDKNSILQQSALTKASLIIEEIVSRQSTIVKLNTEIKQLRNELVYLQAKQLDITTILGDNES
jgi:flagellar biosynthesis chaperone FliJ